jgi:hypothetical protein
MTITATVLMNAQTENGSDIDRIDLALRMLREADSLLSADRESVDGRICLAGAAMLVEEEARAQLGPHYGSSQVCSDLDRMRNGTASPSAKIAIVRELAVRLVQD